MSTAPNPKINTAKKWLYISLALKTMVITHQGWKPITKRGKSVFVSGNITT
jgi:hypothetical protein